MPEPKPTCVYDAAARELACRCNGDVEGHEAAVHLPPVTWTRPDGFTGPCPECRSTTCPGYYKPDGNHLLAF